MKFTIVALFFALTACTIINKQPKFKVGDCITKNPAYLEEWEHPRVIKVVQVGKRQYRIKVTVGIMPTVTALPIKLVDEETIKVECE